MSKRKYQLRFYRLHDLDLLSLERRNVSLTSVLREVLRAYANGKAFLVELPKEEKELDFKRRYYPKHLILDTEEDSEVITMIDRIPDGARNSFFKNLLRLYLCRPYDDRLMKKEDILWFEEKSRGFLKEYHCEKAKMKINRTKKMNLVQFSGQEKIKEEPSSNPNQIKREADHVDIEESIIKEQTLPVTEKTDHDTDEILMLMQDLF